MQLRINAGVEKLKPGLTCWAQINGRDELSLEEKVALEKEYLQRKSLAFEVKIFFMTFTSAFLKKEGVSHLAKAQSKKVKLKSNSPLERG